MGENITMSREKLVQVITAVVNNIVKDYRK
jgi:hypothetical protein